MFTNNLKIRKWMLSVQRWQSAVFQCLSPNLKSFVLLFFLLRPPIQIISKSHQLRQHHTHTGSNHFSPYPSSRLLQQPADLTLLPPLLSYVLFFATVARVILLRCQVMHFLFTMISWISISLLRLQAWSYIPPVLGLNLLLCPLAHPLKPHWLSCSSQYTRQSAASGPLHLL